MANIMTSIMTYIMNNIWFCLSLLGGILSLVDIKGKEMYAWQREKTGAKKQDEESLTGVGEEQKEQRERLWQHGLNEDKNFNDRLNFFLLFQSFLVAGVLTLYQATFLSPGSQAVTYGRSLIIKVSIIGILISIIWMYVQVRQGFQLKILTKRIRECAPEFNVTVGRRNVGVFGRLHATTLLSCYIPALVIALWCTIIYYTPMP